jgi:hypothetical protein
MASAPAERPSVALFVLAHAWYSTKPTTREEAMACNPQMRRTVDFLEHAPARDVAVAGVKLTAAQFDAERENAIRELRARCATCGRCALFGLKPP